jgi:hypothetical protein
LFERSHFGESVLFGGDGQSARHRRLRMNDGDAVLDGRVNGRIHFGFLA